MQSSSRCTEVNAIDYHRKSDESKLQKTKILQPYFKYSRPVSSLEEKNRYVNSEHCLTDRCRRISEDRKVKKKIGSDHEQVYFDKCFAKPFSKMSVENEKPLNLIKSDEFGLPRNAYELFPPGVARVFTEGGCFRESYPEPDSRVELVDCSESLNKTGQNVIPKVCREEAMHFIGSRSPKRNGLWPDSSPQCRNSESAIKNVEFLWSPTETQDYLKNSEPSHNFSEKNCENSYCNGMVKLRETHISNQSDLSDSVDLKERISSSPIRLRSNSLSKTIPLSSGTLDSLSIDTKKIIDSKGKTKPLDQICDNHTKCKLGSSSNELVNGRISTQKIEMLKEKLRQLQQMCDNRTNGIVNRADEIKRQRVRSLSESSTPEQREDVQCNIKTQTEQIIKTSSKHFELGLASGELNMLPKDKKSHEKLIKEKLDLSLENFSSPGSCDSESECSGSEDSSSKADLDCEELVSDCVLLTQTLSAAKINAAGELAFQCPLRLSLFPYVPPYLRFASYDNPGQPLPHAVQRQLRWRLSTITPVVVRKTLVNSGFRLMKIETSPTASRDLTDWMGTWGKHMKSPQFRTLKDYQKMNHFPGTFQLGRKDRLWRNAQRLQVKFGVKEFGFIPRTYVLPQDLKLLRHAWEKAGGQEKWIVKPPASARGTGIRVVHKWAQIPKKKPVIVQRYISQPYLINGSKFDLRLYVLVTSVDPLRIYLYPDGLARFASVKYSGDVNSLNDRYMHLTNYSINKLSSLYTTNENADACKGHKWTIHSLWEYLKKHGIDTKSLWTSLQDLVIKTVLCGESGITQLVRANVNSRYNCYELFGIDVLLDDKLKPWLLEVNISPSLHSASPLDLHVKGPLVRSLLNMAQYHVPHMKLSMEQREEVFKKLGIPESSTLCFDKRLYTMTLDKEERLKHTHFLQFANREDYLEDILSTLTPDDVRRLITAEDELLVSDNFQRIFPSQSSYKYLQLAEPRYYDRLFDAWEHKYGHDRTSGIKLLQSLCEKKYHLRVPSPSTNKLQKSLSEEDSKSIETTMTTTTISTETDRSVEGPSPSRKASALRLPEYSAIEDSDGGSTAPNTCISVTG